MNSQKVDLVSWVLLVVLTIIWGFSYYFIKHSLVSFNPTQISVLRMVFSAVALLPFLPMALKKIPFSKYNFIFICGLIGSFLPAFLYPFAQQQISSSVAGIINAFTPICTYGIGILFYNVPKEKSKILGSIIAFLGAVALIIFKPNATLKADFFYLLVAFVVPFLYGFNGNTLKTNLKDVSGLHVTVLMYLFMAILCIPIGIYSNSFSQIPTAMKEGNALYHLMALSVLGSALAMALFNILVQRVHILFAASVTFLMPIVSVIVGVYDCETIRWNDLLGLFFILVGVLLINNLIGKKKAIKE
ncbi:MAG: EamA family transporter [Saprospiraceae bacterium]|nr:EamA family transporter [Saprospiraceae bacterium]